LSAVQLVLQVPPVPQAYALQPCGAPGLHVPAPSHFPAGVSVAPVQVLVPQDVPAAYIRQAPLPSQNPSPMQVADPWSSHWASGS
jgi:hypothetical protein